VSMSSNTPNIQDAGGKLLTALYVVLRSMRLYPVENIQVQQALDDLHGQMLGFLENEGAFDLHIAGDFFFLNEVRLRLDLSNFSTFGNLASVLAGHGIGEIGVARGVTRGEWAPFVTLLSLAPKDDSFSAFIELLNQSPVEHIDVRPATEAQEPELLELDALTEAKGTYAQSVKVAKDVLTDTRLGKAVNARKVKRAVQGIVDQVLDNETSMVTMTTLRGFDEYTFTHSVNVCIFSVVIGQRLGFTKLQLYELGLGALLHDIGKMRVDTEVINKAGGLTEEEWAQLKDHPTEGLLLLFQMSGFTEVPYRQMLIAYEHHMKVDLSGYPQNERSRDLGLFSRIVAVADGFDAGTSVRSYQYEPWPPDEVLKEMKDNPRRGFDQMIVKALITATGVYPIGTLVILDTKELAVVSKTHPEIGHLHQPTVKVIADANGAPLETPVTLELSLGERTIIGTTDAQQYGIRVSDYLI
jgi:HD-GYP domain-containing protein (c-di-GMP phosphodiesterase class II)